MLPHAGMAYINYFRIIASSSFGSTGLGQLLFLAETNFHAAMTSHSIGMAEIRAPVRAPVIWAKLTRLACEQANKGHLMSSSILAGSS